MHFKNLFRGYAIPLLSGCCFILLCVVTVLCVQLSRYSDSLVPIDTHRDAKIFWNDVDVTNRMEDFYSTSWGYMQEVDGNTAAGRIGDKPLISLLIGDDRVQANRFTPMDARGQPYFEPEVRENEGGYFSIAWQRYDSYCITGQGGRYITEVRLSGLPNESMYTVCDDGMDFYLTQPGSYLLTMQVVDNKGDSNTMDVRVDIKEPVAA